MKEMIRNSCYHGNNASSKRIIMFIFTLMAIFMILVQAVFTAIMIGKFANAKWEGQAFEIYNVFPDIIWYMVFGIIGGIAGINGFSTQKPTEEKATFTVNKTEKDEEVV